MTSYDALAEDYEVWAAEVSDDIDFYVGQALEAGGLIVELGVGTGRVAIPVAKAGARVIGVDASARMLEVCARRAAEAGVSGLIDLRRGEFQRPPVAEQVRLVICPFRSFMHLVEERERGRALAAIQRLLVPGGRFVFDVFASGLDDDDPRAGVWIERAPGIFERSVFDPGLRILDVTLRTRSGEATLRLAMLERDEWRSLLERAGFQIVACYGAFDLRPCAESLSQMVWVAQKD